MWIKSDEDKSVASTWGAVIHLKAGEPRQVGQDLGLLCLQAGCVEIKDYKEVEEPVVEVVEEVVVVEDWFDLLPCQSMPTPPPPPAMINFSELVFFTTKDPPPPEEE